MVKIGKKPFLDIILEYLSNFGFRRFILGIGYKAEFFKKYYSENNPKGLDISFSEELNPLGTGGAVKKAKRLIKSKTFLVLNGDSFCEFDPVDFLKFHKRKKALVSMLLRKVENGADYGEVQFDKNARITGFKEKDIGSRNCFINAGLYIIDKTAFEMMPRKQEFSIEKDFFPALAGKKFFGYIKSGFFIDIGTPERYLKANEYFIKRINHAKF